MQVELSSLELSSLELSRESLSLLFILYQEYLKISKAKDEDI